MVAKIKNLISTESDKIVEPFYVNQQAKNEYAKVSTRIVDKLNAMCEAWEAATKKRVESLEEAQAIVKDAEGYWRSTKIEDNIEQKRPHTLTLLDEGFASTAIQSLLQLPEGFEKVIHAVNQFRTHEINWPYFILLEGRFQLSPFFLNRMDGKIWYHAVTPLQKRRLTLAKKLLATLKELDSLLAEEAQEAGVAQPKIDKALTAVAHVGPVPYCLKVVNKSAPGTWMVIEQELAVNEEWVVKGNAIYADQIGMSGLRTDRKTPLPKGNPIVYLKYKRTDGDGGRRLYIVPKAEKDSAYIGAMNANIEFQPGEFIIDHQSGKLVQREH